MPNDDLAERIPSMSRLERKRLRENALRILEKKPDDPRVLATLQALDAIDPPVAPRVPFSTGCLEWEMHHHARPDFHARHNGEVVATVTKHYTHKSDRKDVYTVEVLGRNLEERFAEIAKARLAAEMNFRRIRNIIC